MKRNNTLFLVATGLVWIALASCSKGPEDTGTEYAAQMYHSVPYEDYTQILDSTSEDYNSNPLNPHRSNLRLPAAHTIARKQFAGQPGTQLAGDIMEYNIPHPDSIDWSARTLKNPLTPNPTTLEEGKVLYTSYCSPCHGAEGKGNGKVADQYKGVPSYSVGRVATVSAGHIFHTITYGKGRMWPHGTQIMPQDRWKIVLYVQTLQKQK